MINLFGFNYTITSLSIIICIKNDICFILMNSKGEMKRSNNGKHKTNVTTVKTPKVNIVTKRNTKNYTLNWTIIFTNLEIKTKKLIIKNLKKIVLIYVMFIKQQRQNYKNKTETPKTTKWSFFDIFYGKCFPFPKKQ